MVLNDRYFCIAGMKKNMLKYFAAVFFISIYLLKGIVTVMPVFFSGGKSDFLITASIDTEENEKRNNGEKLDSETKELYLHHNSLLNVSLPGTIVKTVKTPIDHTAIIKHIDRSIPTPPPELS